MRRRGGRRWRKGPGRLPFSGKPPQPPLKGNFAGIFLPPFSRCDRLRCYWKSIYGNPKDPPQTTPAGTGDRNARAGKARNRFRLERQGGETSPAVRGPLESRAMGRRHNRSLSKYRDPPQEAPAGPEQPRPAGRGPVAPIRRRPACEGISRAPPAQACEGTENPGAGPRGPCPKGEPIALTTSGLPLHPEREGRPDETTDTHRPPEVSPFRRKAGPRRGPRIFFATSPDRRGAYLRHPVSWTGSGHARLKPIPGSRPKPACPFLPVPRLSPAKPITPPESLLTAIPACRIMEHGFGYPAAFVKSRDRRKIPWPMNCPRFRSACNVLTN